MYAKTGPAFSIEVIDSEPLPQVPKHLMPWIVRDRREAVEGSMVKDKDGKMVHNGEGLDRAEKSLKQIKAALASNPKEDYLVARFLEEQFATANGKVEFYRGKIYLLDKIISSGGI